MCVWRGRWYMHTLAGASGDRKRASDPIALQSQVVVNHLAKVLRAERESSARAVQWNLSQIVTFLSSYEARLIWFWNAVWTPNLGSHGREGTSSVLVKWRRKISLLLWPWDTLKTDRFSALSAPLLSLLLVSPNGYSCSRISFCPPWPVSTPARQGLDPTTPFQNLACLTARHCEPATTPTWLVKRPFMCFMT